MGFLFLLVSNQEDDSLKCCRPLLFTTEYPAALKFAKVRVVLKRFGQSAESEYADGRLTVDFDAKQVFVGGRAIKLTALEFKLLPKSA